MKRKVIDELINWKTEYRGIPILLTGAKGVGKTYLAYDFAKAFFEHIFYINFERDPLKADLFQCIDGKSIGDELSDYLHLPTDVPLDNIILILDEIGCCTDALNALRDGQLQAVFPNIVVISSNILAEKYTVNLKRLSIFPLEFDEFLRAISNEWYIETIVNHYQADKKIPEIVHKELLALHQLYLQIGGMPGIINEYLNLSSTINVSERHSSIIGSYHDYILRDNSDSEALKMNQVFDSLVYQLTKENKKFQYKIIRKGTTHTMYRDAIQKLSDQNYIIRCNRISTEQLQNPSELVSINNTYDEANTNFKLYLPDTGLLYTRIIEEQGITAIEKHKKALLENYIAQAFQARNYPLAFWESDSMAKIDFIIAKNQDLIPIEVHESDITRSKSISIIKQKYEFPYAVKISSKNFEFANSIKYVPYYAVFCL